MIGNLVQVSFCNWDSKMEIPPSDSFANPVKKGYLLKLTGRGWLYSGSWKKRYCILEGSKFYFYENEQSKGNEKTCGVVNLDYYDVCEESSPKDKKNPHVFIVGTSVRGFFDNRHQFAAESSADLQSWMRAIQAAIAEARTNRRKPKRHLEGKSPDLSTSSQESEGTSTACLVNATKDRARGPQGRRLPQRKSLMPASRSVEEADIRQRSISLSDAQRTNAGDSSPSSKSPPDGKWLSLSMEEVDREKEPDSQRSSSAFDLPQHQEPRKRVGNLLGQHAALTKELEMRLKSGRAPAHVRPPSESEEEEPAEEQLTTRVNSALTNLEEKVGLLSRRVEATHEKNEKAASQMGDVMLQVTVTLQEAERVNAECKRVLADANKARSEYQLLARECRETLAKLSGAETRQNGA